MGQTCRHTAADPRPSSPTSFTFAPSALLAAHQYAALGYLAAERIHTLSSYPAPANSDDAAQRQGTSDACAHQLAAIATIGHTARCALSIASCPGATLTLASDSHSDSIADLALLGNIANGGTDAAVLCAMPEFKRRGMHAADLGVLGGFLGECFRGCETAYNAAFVGGFEEDEDEAWWWWNRARVGGEGVGDWEEGEGTPDGVDDEVEAGSEFQDGCM